MTSSCVSIPGGTSPLNWDIKIERSLSRNLSCSSLCSNSFGVGSKLIILDNASSHRNQLVKDVIKKDNNLLYAVPYQHYTNAIEGYFNVLKSRLQKKKGLTYDELVKNVKDVLDEMPIHIYKNLIKGAYDRSEKYVKRPSTRKRKPKKYLD